MMTTLLHNQPIICCEKCRSENEYGRVGGSQMAEGMCHECGDHPRFGFLWRDIIVPPKLPDGAGVIALMWLAFGALMCVILIMAGTKGCV